MIEIDTASLKVRVALFCLHWWVVTVSQMVIKMWVQSSATFQIFMDSSDIFQRHEENLALPSVEKGALECVKAGLETWEYKAKNALMYYPEGKTTKLGLTSVPVEGVPLIKCSSERKSEFCLFFT